MNREIRQRSAATHNDDIERSKARFLRAAGDQILDRSTAQRMLILMAAAATTALGYGMVMPLLPSIVDRVAEMPKGPMSWHVGSLGGTYMAGILIGAPACGWCSDRIGRRPVILFGLGVFAAAILIIASAATLWPLYIGQFFSGVAAGAVIPTSMAYVADISEPQIRPHRFGAVGMAVAFGFLLGPGISAALASISSTPGLSTADVGMQLPFLVTLLVAVGVWIVVYVGLTEPSASPISASDPMAFHRRPPALWFALVSAATFGLGIFEVAVTLRGQQVLQLDPAALAATFMVCGLVMLLAQGSVFLPSVSALIRRRATAPAFLVMTVGLLLITAATNRIALGIYVGIVAAGYAMLTLALAYHVSLAAGNRYGAAFGKQTALASLGQGLGSASAGFLFVGFQQAPFIVGAVILLTGAATAMTLKTEGPETGNAAE